MERRRKKAFASIAVFFALALWSLEGFAYTLLEGNFELKGFVRNITAVRTDDPHVGKGLGGERFEKGDVELSRSFLQAEGTYTVSPGLKVYGRWRGSYDASYDMNETSHAIPKEVIDDQRIENEFRELYVDIRKGPLFLRLGKQQVVWGESDGLRLADIINPLDLSWHYLFENWEDTRIGLPMIRAIYAVTPKTDLEFVWAPVSFEPTKFGGKGTYWEIPPLGKGGLFPLPVAPGVVLNLPIQQGDVPTGMKNGSVGGKIKTSFGSGFDVSLYDYYHRYEMPTLQMTPTEGLPIFSLVYPYVNSIGGTFNTFVDPIKTVFRGEAVYNHGEPQQDFTKPDFISKKDTIAFMVGVDRPTYLPINSESSFLSFQYFHKKVLNTDPTTVTFGDINNRKPDQTILSGILSTPYPKLIPNSILTPSVTVFYDTVGAGWFRPMLNLRYGDSWSVTVAANKFWGHDNNRGFFNPINDRSEAYVDVKYSFQ
jgi:hypothetical protein